MPPMPDYKAVEVALLRLPAFSIAHYLAILENSEQTKQKLCEFFANSYARDALTHMAPEFWQRTRDRLAANQITDDDAATLLRYANRLCFRTTPFGMSATVSALPVAPGTLPAAGSREQIRHEVGLDELALSSLIETTDDETCERRWLVNDTLYELHGTLRFVKLARGNAGMLSSVEKSPYLSAVLAFAATPKTGNQIATHLITSFPDDELSIDDCQGYIEQLIEQQLLTQDHLYSLTDRQSVEAEIARLHPDTWAAAMREINEFSVPGRSMDQRLSAAKECLGKQGEQTPDRAIWRIDSWRDLATGDGIPADIMREVESAIRILRALTRPISGQFQTTLDKWEARYGDADIPLMLVCDEANGLYSDDARADQGIIASLPGRRSSKRTSASLMQEQLLAAYQLGASEIDLSKSDVDRYCNQAGAANPPCGTGWFRFLQGNDSSDFMVALLGFGSWPVGRLFGRFCAGDPQLLAVVNAATRYGQPDNTILAELVFHPRGRVGNVCQRPVLSDYEVTIRTGVASTVPRLALSDLVVCRDGERLRLRSISLGKWVDLRFSTAHNHELRSNLKLYQFLAELVGQDTPALGEISRRNQLADMVRFPRVKYGRIVLDPASWRLASSHLSSLKAAKSDQELLAVVASLRTRFDMPEWVVYADGDNELLLSLSNLFCLRELQGIVKNASALLLTEFTPPGYTPAIHGTDGSYNNECLIAFTRQPQSMPGNPARRAAIGMTSEPHAARSYGPYSEWIYLRLAVQPVFQDAVLQRIWSDLIVPYRAKGDIDAAFYVRYGDQGGQHLRIRFHVTSPDGQSTMAIALANWLDAEGNKGAVTEARIDTYAPEWNRYGGVAAMPHAHALFSASADMCMVVTAAKDKKLAIGSVDAMLTALGLSSPQQKLEFARKHARGFANEYDMTPKIRKQVADLANQAGDLAALRLQFWDVAHLNDAIGEVTRAGAALADLAALDQLCTPLADIHSSVLHMHLNRLFAENPRAQEAVFWDVLRRMYERHCALHPS